MKLILHIGMPRTGTTALQQSLDAMHEHLLEHGILYPRTPKNAGNHNFLRMLTGNLTDQPDLFRIRLETEKEDFLKHVKRSWQSLQQQVEKYRPDTLILSGEYLFNAPPSDINRALRGALLGLSEDITTVVYVRQPSKLYLSMVQQGMKHSRQIIAPQPVLFLERLAAWRDYLSTEPRVLAYEREELINADITSDFLNRILPAETAARLSIQSVKANESLSAESMSILQDYRSTLYPQSDFYQFTDVIALRRALSTLENTVVAVKRPKLRDALATYIDQASTDLLELREAYGIHFQQIDYSAIGRTSTPSLPVDIKVEDICPVDEGTKIALHAHAMKYLHDNLQNKIDAQKRRRRSLLGLFR